MLTVYRIPLLERFVEVGTRPIIGGIRKYVVVDGIGLLVEHAKGTDISQGEIRRHLIGERGTFALVEASSPAEAIHSFLSGWEGAKTGEKGPESMALRIDRKQPILEYPKCSLLHRSREKRYLCGPEVGRDGNGEFGICVLEGFDGPDFYCPIAEFATHLSDKQLAKTLETETVDGYEVVRAESLVLGPDEAIRAEQRNKRRSP